MIQVVRYSSFSSSDFLSPSFFFVLIFCLFFFFLDVLRRVSVPCSAAIYYEDACVVRQFSLEVAQIMPGMRTWVTSDYEHNGSSVDGERILNKLLIMLKEPQKHYI